MYRFLKLDTLAHIASDNDDGTRTLLVDVDDERVREFMQSSGIIGIQC